MDRGKSARGTRYRTMASIVFSLVPVNKRKNMGEAVGFVEMIKLARLFIANEQLEIILGRSGRQNNKSVKVDWNL